MLFNWIAGLRRQLRSSAANRRRTGRWSQQHDAESLESRLMMTVDLVALYENAPSQADQGDRIQVSFGIANQGTSTTPRFWRYTHTLEDQNGNRVATLDETIVPDMRGNSTLRLAERFNIPSSLPDGVYRMVFTVDSTGRVSELSESNNVATDTITIGSPPPPPPPTVPGNDSNDQIREASSFGLIDSTKTKTGFTIDKSRDVDMFSFRVDAGDNVQFDLDVPDSSELFGRIRVFDGSGKELAKDAFGNAPDELWDLTQNAKEAYLDYTFATAGTYYVGVSGSNNDDYDAVTGGGDKSEPRIGSFSLTLQPGERVRPTATGSASDITLGLGNSQTITVVYSDNEAVDVSDFDSDDIQVTGPNGYDQTATFVSRSRDTDGTPVTATYRIDAPGSSWTAADNGTYSIRMNVVEVSDINGNFVDSGEIGSFLVAIGGGGPVIQLSDLDGSDGFRIEGIDVDDRTGYPVSNAGDVNGDGFDDVIIGAHLGDPNGRTDAGESYVVFGRSGGFGGVVDPATLDGTNGFRIDGAAAGDFAGSSLAGAGDVNGDGFDDLIVGAPGADSSGAAESGAAFVVFGRPAFSATLDLSTLDGNNGFRLNGNAEGDWAGIAVSGAGDVNGDGLADVLIGADEVDSGSAADAGESYVVFGQSDGFTGSIDLASLNSSNGFRIEGVSAEDFSGFAVSSAGDVNGDGLDDLIIGAYGADSDGRSMSGSSYVIYGTRDGFTPTVNPAGLDGTNGFRIDGIDADDYSGAKVAGAGDVNGDGVDDLIIGAVGADPNDVDFAGESYVLFGNRAGFNATFDLATLDGSNGFRLTGVRAGERSGFPVGSAGDVNGDGYDDLVIGASARDPHAGSGYVVFGRASGFAATVSLDSLETETGIRLAGIDADDLAGDSISSAGDVNGDGYDDLVIGAPFADPAGINQAGEAYIVFGGDFSELAGLQAGDSGADTLQAVRGADVDMLIGGANSDILISDGGADILRGGEGDDHLVIRDADFNSTRRLSGGNGSDTLRLDGAGITLDLTAISDNRLTDVEQIDITGNGDNTLILNFQEVVNISSQSNTLLVRHDNGDVVEPGSGWTRLSDTETIGSTTYDMFTQGTTTLGIEVQAASPASVELVGRVLTITGSPSDDHVTVSASGTQITVDANGTSSSFDSADIDRIQFTGEAGNDTFTNQSNLRSILNGGAGDDSLSGGSNKDTLYGGAGHDRLIGFHGRDLIDGQGGNDTCLGSAHNDTLIGGDGDDFLDGQGSSHDVLIINASEGADDITMQRSGVYTLIHESAAAPFRTNFRRTEHISLNTLGGDDSLQAADISDAGYFRLRTHLGDGDDSVDFSASANSQMILVAVGGMGQDTLTGGPGRDRLNGGAGSSTLFGNAGNDTLVGGESADEMSGGDGEDRLRAFGGDDTLSGGGDRDWLYGGDGNDVLDGGDGRDRLQGQNGNDHLRGGADRDTILGGAGDDTLDGGQSHDALSGADGHDLLIGGSGHDTLHSADGDDSLFGGTGDDILLAGDGDDAGSGQRGDDTIVTGSGADTIAAEPGEIDEAFQFDAWWLQIS